MKPEPANIDGKVVETHEFAHSVEHQVNWSHFLFAVVALVAIYKVGPAVSTAVSSGNDDKRR